MKLKEMALVAEILTALAVVISLIFVGLQVRQSAVETSLNTRAIEASAFQELSAQVNDINFLVIENSEFAELVARVMLDGESTNSSKEFFQIDMYMRSIIRHGEVAYLQFESGLIDEESFKNMLTPVGFVLVKGKADEVWQAIRARNSRYTDYVDAWIAGSVTD